MTYSRWVGLAALLVAMVASLVRFLSGTPSLDGSIRVVVWILLLVPIKGALLRFLGGMRPYWSALAANTTSEIIGLGFPLSALGMPWQALAASSVLSTGSEGLTFGVLRTAYSWKRSFGIALYVNFFVHLLMAGVFLCWPDLLSSEASVAAQPLVGSAIILVSFLVFILPIFLVSRSSTTDFSRR